jgi:hypothetical protein
MEALFSIINPKGTLLQAKYVVVDLQLVMNPDGFVSVYQQVLELIR